MIVQQHKDLYVFFCPGCKSPHMLNTRWSFNNDFVNPTFEPSVLIHLGDHVSLCHSFVRNGKIQFLSDCKHELAGQTVPLPEIPSHYLITN